MLRKNIPIPIHVNYVIARVSDNIQNNNCHKRWKSTWSPIHSHKLLLPLRDWSINLVAVPSGISHPLGHVASLFQRFRGISVFHSSCVSFSTRGTQWTIEVGLTHALYNLLSASQRLGLALPMLDPSSLARTTGSATIQWDTTLHTKQKLLMARIPCHCYSCLAM